MGVPVRYITTQARKPVRMDNNTSLGHKKYTCVPCGGKGVCSHGRERYYCPTCNGKGTCVHGKNKRYCHECKHKNKAAGSPAPEVVPEDDDMDKTFTESLPTIAKEVEAMWNVSITNQSTGTAAAEAPDEIGKQKNNVTETRSEINVIVFDVNKTHYTLYQPPPPDVTTTVQLRGGGG